MEKHFVYHQLLDSIGQDTCPICSLLNNNEDKFIESFLYESVCDRELRAEIRKSKGFCNFHAWKLHSAGDPLAHSIIYKGFVDDEINTIQSFIKGGKIFNRSVEDLAASLTHKEKCRVCKLHNEGEKSYISSFLNYYSHESQFRDRFDKSGLLCIPHLSMMLRIYMQRKLYRFWHTRSEAGRFDALLSAQIEKLKKLSFDLGEIQRKNDYRFALEQLTDDEKSAWTRVVKHQVGEPGMSDNIKGEQNAGKAE